MASVPDNRLPWKRVEPSSILDSESPFSSGLESEISNRMDNKAASTSYQESRILSAQAIQEIENELGDVGRGADFPMSRARGSSTSSRDSGNGVPPPPTRPPPVPHIPNEHRLATRRSDVGGGGGDSLPLPRVRPSRPRCASTPITSSTTPAVRSRQRESQEQVPCETARPVSGGGLCPARAPSTPAPSTAPKCSLFPPVQSFPVSPAAPSCSSSSTAEPSAVLSYRSRCFSPFWLDEFSRPLRPQDLDPESPYGYPAPPAFLHNWETPNRACAKGAVNAATAHRAGKIGPPVGSRPRPIPAVAVASTAPVYDPVPLHSSLDFPSVPTLVTGGFAYSSMMSPYEAQTSLDWPGPAAGVRCPPDNPRLGRRNGAREGGEKGGRGGQGESAQAQACRFPRLEHELLSAEEAAAAITAAAGVRNTIFIDRGIDLGGTNGASSCYGNEDEVGRERRVREDERKEKQGSM
ncbi:hypothetical protein MYCTH_2113448 [Thermothelomyces thermophilus ATCC 42464]|uniref:Uncharacterized protein n=1 Tax=Thermothelomyces thermophilus (strain ATCC 42464 / BCRC 31852 / DSM 1799) TaxID=573729 RepID=G2QPM9_THET4|nr:uncharacterized protein MYCTH_2113448 [Thermothelomyces thermophilus ATCC 42464]AEO61542.1 hypothetical protein MYCTH_2113448 [Thermothelomyces thermophilus ATCC 42464]